YLVARNWTRVLVLEGPAPADKREVAAFQRSARKFGATVGEVRPFVLGEDPRHRNENNVALLTAGADPDVIFVADSGGEEGRYVPYETSKPTPVVGDAGLMALAWHWSWFRNGAPQLQHRFEKLAMPRRMNGNAWAAWAAVKAVTTAAMRSDPKSFDKMRKFMLGPKIGIDGAKGRPMSFRPWNHQLRQQILLATPDAVIANAPLPQYLHETNVLDTLGTDAPETKCHF
ncbi:MAG TPA: amino acid ABC transporter substrate-binding protein, partial [Pararhizobium sp.]|nr:amino acid ABC transporter substrate-binding protein [Pararhizobium sp.]